MLSAYYICCLHSYAFYKTFTIEANTVNPMNPSTRFILFCDVGYQSTKADERVEEKLNYYE